jgi:hypothetical protein
MNEFDQTIKLVVKLFILAFILFVIGMLVGCEVKTSVSSTSLEKETNNTPRFVFEGITPYQTAIYEIRDTIGSNDFIIVECFGAGRPAITMHSVNRVNK